MRTSIILVLCGIGVSLALDDRSAFGQANTADIDRTKKTVDVAYNGFKYGQRATPVNLDASNRDFVKGVADRRQQFLAGVRNGVGTANLGAHRGNVIAFDQGSDPNRIENLQGGVVSAGNHRGNMKLGNNQEGAKTVADFEGSQNTELKTGLTGADPAKFGQAFAQNQRINAQLDPITQNRDDGKGTLLFREMQKGTDDFYLYKIDKDQRTKLTDVHLTSSQGRSRQINEAGYDALFNNAERWHCTAAVNTYGESKCRDQRGQEVGRVITTKKSVRVYDRRGVPIAEGQVIAQPQRRSFESVVGKGLLNAKVTDLKEQDCAAEYGGKAGDIKIKRPLKFSYPHTDSLGRIRLAWPSCFMIGADIEVGPGIDIEALAIEYYAALSPLGKLACSDAATCGSQCYYCDICKNQHKYNMMRTSKSNICNVTGVRQFTAEVEVCPPPGEFEDSVCTTFAKDLDYYTNKTKLGNGVFQVIAWQMPLNKEALRKEFFDKINNPILGKANRLLLWTEFKSEVGASALVSGLTAQQSTEMNEEILEWYVGKRRRNNMKVAACYRESLNYSYGGSKADASVLVDVATTRGENIFRKECPKKTQTDAEQYKMHEDNHKANSGGSGGGILGGLGGLLGGG